MNKLGYKWKRMTLLNPPSSPFSVVVVLSVVWWEPCIPVWNQVNWCSLDQIPRPASIHGGTERCNYSSVFNNYLPISQVALISQVVLSLSLSHKRIHKHPHAIYIHTTQTQRWYGRDEACCDGRGRGVLRWKERGELLCKEKGVRNLFVMTVLELWGNFLTIHVRTSDGENRWPEENCYQRVAFQL